jgi:hypothetical protein
MAAELRNGVLRYIARNLRASVIRRGTSRLRLPEWIGSSSSGRPWYLAVGVSFWRRRPFAFDDAGGCCPCCPRAARLHMQGFVCRVVYVPMFVLARVIGC